MPWWLGWIGWNSIEWTGFWSSFYFWFGIICLFLLGASEVASHYYGERNGSLIRESARIAAEEREQQQQQIDKRHASEMTKANNAIAMADKELKEMREKFSPRHLTESQKEFIITAISPFSGQAVKITSNAGDIESDDFAREFYDVIIKAGWDYKGTPGTFETHFAGYPVGIEVAINYNDVVTKRLPIGTANAYNALMDAFHKLGIVNSDEPAILNPQVPTNMIEIRVGAKPPLPGQTGAARHRDEVKPIPR